MRVHGVRSGCGLEGEVRARVHSTLMLRTKGPVCMRLRASAAEIRLGFGVGTEMWNGISQRLRLGLAWVATDAAYRKALSPMSHPATQRRLGRGRVRACGSVA